MSAMHLPVALFFTIANLLLVAAIDIAGLAVAFPVAIGLALVGTRNDPETFNLA